MRILWVKMGGLWPLNTGGRQRSYHVLRELSRRHQVVLVTTEGPADDPSGLAAALDRCERIVSVPCVVQKSNSAGFALTLVVYFFAFGTPLKAGTRAFLLIMSPLIAILCNVIRLVPTSLIFGYGNSDTAQRFHDLAGWIMLPIAMLMLYGLLRTIRWLEFPVTQLRLASQ